MVSLAPQLLHLSTEAAAYVRPANYLLVKLAARCNLKCSYCYWFRDPSVYGRPKVMTEEVEAALLEKLQRHLVNYGLDRFYLLFHGGEPTLFGRDRFEQLTGRLRALEARLGVQLRLAMTTNGLLLDDDWIDVLKRHQVSVTLSFDGPPQVNDTRRIDFVGRGSLQQSVAALQRLRAADLEPGVLAVCDPTQEPRLVTDYFVQELHIQEFDILVPDATHEDHTVSIADYYKRLFDIWLDELAPRGVRIRYLDSLIAGLAGYESHSESIGYGPNLHFTMLTDGSLEALDTVRIAGPGITNSCLNILTDEIQDLVRDPFWRELLEASVHLHRQCEQCVYRSACGGGHIASRWSRANRFDNPSVYCRDLIEILRHIWQRMAPDLYLVGIPPDAACNSGSPQNPAKSIH